MSTISVIVTAYNNGQYLSGCLKSILNQSYTDWECVVVNDCSPDNVSSIAHQFAESDKRFKVLDLLENGGLHLARKAGLNASDAEHILFLDADDELASKGFEELVQVAGDYDMVHFGIDVVDAGSGAEASKSFASFINTPQPDWDSSKLLLNVFAKDGGYLQDWRVTQRLYKRSVAVEAFGRMVDSRLERAEDCYEFLALADCASSQLTANQVKPLVYYFGRGVTGTSKIPLQRFENFAHQFDACIKAIERYAGIAKHAEVGERCVEGAKHKLFDLLMNDWLVRLSDDDKVYCLDLLAEVMGGRELSIQLARLSRDVAYEALSKKASFAGNEPFATWLKHAFDYAGDDCCDAFNRRSREAVSHLVDLALGDVPIDEITDAARLVSKTVGSDAAALGMAEVADNIAYRSLDSGCDLKTYERARAILDVARSVVSDLAGEDYKKVLSSAVTHLTAVEHKLGGLSGLPEVHKPSKDCQYACQDIKIFVTTHKDVNLFDSSILQPVQVGFKKPRARFAWAYQDDSGCNISSKNAWYCELTTQYWAWKNADARYYGFCHYRRYFDFSDVVHQENACGEVMDACIDWDSQKRYCLDDEHISRVVEGYDILTTRARDLGDFPEAWKDPIDQYSRAAYLHVADLERVFDLAKEMYPDFIQDIDAFANGHSSCFCNMFIMRKELFFGYCEWLFPLLQKFEETWDKELLSHEALRTPGHLSERLLNIWIMHEKRVNPELKCKELQCVHFEQPERLPSPQIEPADGHGLPVVPVVFAADNNYVPMVTTTAYSMLENASHDFFYDVIILEKDFSDYNKRIMSEFFAQFENTSVRFVNVAGMVGAYNLQTSNEHISVETYYRFLIQKILPGYDKVVYLDSDLIVKGDVSELYATDLGTNLLGAARDIDFLGNLNMDDGKRMEYTKEVLQMENPYDYFQAGVLVLNTAEMRKLYPFEKWLEIAAEPKYIYDDQDILNAHCQGRVTYLDNAWNVMNDCGGRIKKVFSFAPADVFDSYMAAYSAPKILHYAGFEKPWKPGPCDMSEAYWRYARLTPFYENILSMKFANKTQVSNDIKSAIDDLEYRLVTPPRAISETSPLRKLFDGALPYGSRRREVAKSVVRKMRGRN